MPTGDTLTTASAGGTADRIGLSVDEVRKLLGISRSFAYELVRDGALPSLRLGRRIIVPLAPLQRMLRGDSLEEDDGPRDPAA
jgi:excisionase family DNA binding protein